MLLNKETETEQSNIPQVAAYDLISHKSLPQEF